MERKSKFRSASPVFQVAAQAAAFLLITLSFAGLAQSVPAAPKPKPSVPLLVDDPTGKPPKGDKGTIRSKPVKANTAGLKAKPLKKGSVLDLNLFDDANFKGTVEIVIQRSETSYSVWGTVDGDPASDFIVTVEDDAMSAEIHQPGKSHYRVRPGPDGSQGVEQVDDEALRGCATCEKNDAVSIPVAPEPPKKTLATRSVSLNVALTDVTGPPANDNFASAMVVSGISGSITGTNVGATAEAGEQSTAANIAPSHSVWWKWTATYTGMTTVDTAGSSFDTGLAVNLGSTLSGLNQVVRNDDAPGVTTSLVSFQAVAGTEYVIQVDGYAGQMGNVVLNWKGANVPKEDGSVIDLMVLYTSAARSAAGGASGIKSSINMAVDYTNQAFFNSQIHPMLNLVYAGEINYAESGNVGTDNIRLMTAGDGFMDDVPALRDQYAADMVDLVTETGDLCGVSGAVLRNYMDCAPYSYATVMRACLPVSFAHENGHLLGCVHNRQVEGVNKGFFPYSYGYWWSTPLNQYGTYDVLGDLMSYASASYRICGFSNPNVSYNGIPTGVADGHLDANGNPDSADNARTINDTAVIVANYRVRGGTTPPPAPPANDPFTGSGTMTGTSGQVTGTNNMATKESGEPMHADNAGGKSVWWKWMPSVSGNYTIDTNGSSIDTLLGVYCGGSVSGLSCMVCNNDFGAGKTSCVTINAVAGQCYCVAVDGTNGAAGNVVLNWKPTPVTPPTGADLVTSWTTALKVTVGTKISITAKLRIDNKGNVKSGTCALKYYLASSPQVNPATDLMLKSVNINGINPGSNTTNNASFSVVLGTPTAGKYIVGVIDANSVVTEQNESNNSAAAGPMR